MTWNTYDQAVRDLLTEARRLQALDGFPAGAGSAWFAKRGLPGVRWIATERHGAFGGVAGLVMDGHWNLAAVGPEHGGCGDITFAVLMAEHVLDWTELTALAATALTHRIVRLVPQSADFVERLMIQYTRNTLATRSENRDHVLQPFREDRR